MSDTMTMSMRVVAHDDASATIRKITASLRALESQIRKSFAGSGMFSKVGAESVKAAAANHRSQLSGILAVSRAEIAGLRFKAKVEAGIRRERERAEATVARASATAIRDSIRSSAQAVRARVSDERIIAREAAKSERDRASSIRKRMAFETAMARQRAGEERAAAREFAQGERERARSMRESIKLDRYRISLRERHERDQDRERGRDRGAVLRHGRHAWDRGSELFTRSTRAAAATGALGAAGLGVLMKKSVGAESSIDEAEVNSRIYGGLSKSTARDLREKWAEPLAEQLGIGTDNLINGYVEALKLGIPSDGAKAFAGLSTKTAEAWSLPFESVSDILGTVNSILTSEGAAFDFGKIKEVANSIQYLAQKQSTTPEKMVEFLRQGAGASQVLGMSMSAGLAFGSASTSLGNKAGESGSLFDYTAGRIIDLPRLAKKKGDEADRARELVRALGYGSADAMDAERRADPDEFLPKFFERFSKISDPKLQDKALKTFFKTEWFGEGSRLVKGFSTYKEAAQLQKESKNIDAIEDVWRQHVEKLSFTGKQFSAGFKNILGEFGKELTPLARIAGDYFLNWSSSLRSGSLRERFKASIQGFIEGLGFKDLKNLLESFFGKPAEGDAGSIRAWADAARGFGSGIRDIGTAIRSVVTVFAGSSNPETIGRWTGRIIALSGALLLLSPVIGTLGTLASTILALGFALRGINAVGGLMGAARAGAAAGAVGTAGAATGAGAVGGGILARMGLSGLVGRLLGGLGLAIVAELGSKRGEIATMLGAPKIVGLLWDGIKSFLSEIGTGLRKALSIKGIVSGLKSLGSEFVPAPVERYFRTDPSAGPNAAPNTGSFDPETSRRRIDALQEETNKRLEELNRSLKPQKQSFLGGGIGGLIQNASFSGSSDARDLKEIFRGQGARLQLAAFSSSGAGSAFGGSGGGSFGGGGGSGGGNASDALTSTPGGALGRGPLGRRGIIGGGGGGGSGGGGRGGSSGMVGYGANPGAYKGLLDHIAQAEGTAGQPGGGYNTSLAFGKFLPGGKEQDLTKLTLDQIDQLQGGMLAHPSNNFNSSAIGRYQIVRKTLRGLRQKLGLKGSDLYNEAMQDRLGAELARQRGANGSLGQEWASLRGGKLQRAIDLAGAIPRGSSTTPGDRPAGADAAASSVGARGGTSASGNIQGSLSLDGETFGFGSGGHRGANSIPFGTYPITPDAIGPWSRANGGIGINGNAIWDKSLGRMRAGIVFHAASNANRITAGCIGIARDQWQRFREKTLAFYRKNGGAFLTVNPDGSASITARPNTGSLGKAPDTSGVLGNGAGGASSGDSSGIAGAVAESSQSGNANGIFSGDGKGNPLQNLPASLEKLKDPKSFLQNMPHAGGKIENLDSFLQKMPYSSKSAEELFKKYDRGIE